MIDTFALLLIDIQKGLDEVDFYGGYRNNPNAENNAAILLNWFREKNKPIFHIKHSSTNPNSPLHASKEGFSIKEVVKPLPTEPVITKNVNSAFIGTDLQKHLQKQNIKNLIIAGLTTNHCISSTVRMAANLGFEVNVIADACAAFDQFGIENQRQGAELVHQITLGNLKTEFAQIFTTQEILQTLNNHF
ncbi:isochorismatase [Croceivirga lutea]|uniref:cysteine hydrolase family protein n=1 Tax=Croceivirga lutea TaxID=1775167 RepID=UPI00163B5847|nr:cysteine hydrolase family protein [Croceivirga lutea]GGG47930.1 isochorismatase [Croceivirga lutea]